MADKWLFENDKKDFKKKLNGYTKVYIEGSMTPEEARKQEEWKIKRKYIWRKKRSLPVKSNQ